MIDLDNSFIRLRSSFDDAKNLSDSPEVKKFYNEQVRLRTDETYLQQTNVSTGISFQSGYVVTVVNCENEDLEVITDRVFIYEFSDYTGTQQIAFEIRNIGSDFAMENVFLRFESSTNPEYVFFSCPIIITDIDSEYTTYFEYRNDSIWHGTDYTTVPYYHSIRLNVYFSQFQDANEIDQYFQMTTGNTISPRALIKRFSLYKAEELNGWVQRRLDVMLTCNTVYANQVRSFYSSPMEYGDRIEVSNIMKTTFLLNEKETDTKVYVDQIYSTIPLAITTLLPIAVSYPSGSLPTIAECTFNQAITLQTGSLKVYNSSDTLIHEFTEAELAISGNKLITTGDLNTYIADVGSYYILMDIDLIQSATGEDFAGITSTTEWSFSTYAVQTGIFNSTFNSTFN